MLHDPRQVDLFPKLSDQELTRLKEHGRELQLNPDDVLFQEGDPTYHFYIVLEGQVRITRRVDGKEQLLVIHESGQFTGEISMVTGSPALVTARSLGPSRVLEIEPDAFREILTECSEGASVILSAMIGRSRELEAHLRQQEKLAALGRLSAGLAHELNNPAAAGRRAAQELRSTIATVQARLLKLCEEVFAVEQQQLLVELQQAAIAYSANAPRLDPLTQSDREDALSDWLEEQNIPHGWKLAPTLVAAGIDSQKLENLLQAIRSTQDEASAADNFADALNWLTETLALAGLVNEIEHSTTRISQLVKAIKSYSYMDQAPLQELDIHEGLENTLTILNHKLKHGVTVQRNYATNVPRICAYGSELNQIWTNLIDNAIHAMQGKGTLTISTAYLDDRVQVEVTDTGAGIPPDIQSRIFDPFFTTKGVGEGSGLGLDIVRRIVAHHHGEIHVTSKPGATRFQLQLPLKP